MQPRAPVNYAECSEETELRGQQKVVGMMRTMQVERPRGTQLGEYSERDLDKAQQSLQLLKLKMKAPSLAAPHRAVSQTG